MKTNQPIWVISAHNSNPYAGNSRTFGFFYTLEAALEAVEQNQGDLQELLFTDLVIEKVFPGILSPVKQEIWFLWVNNRWVRSKRPAWAKGICCFGMG